MKRCFFNGLATLLSLAMTLDFVFFMFNLFTDPFVDFFRQLQSCSTRQPLRKKRFRKSALKDSLKQGFTSLPIHGRIECVISDPK